MRGSAGGEKHREAESGGRWVRDRPGTKGFLVPRPRPDQGAMLMPAEITTGPRSFEPEAVPSRENVFAKSEPAARDDEEDDVDVNSVFAKLKSLKQPE